MAATGVGPFTAPAFVDGIEGYALLKSHARSCDACLADLTLALVSITITGELIFDVNLCPRGEQLLAAVNDDLWPNPH